MPVYLNTISGYLCYLKCLNYPTHFQPTTVYKQNISLLPFVANIQQVILGKNTTLQHFSQHSPPKHFEGTERHTVMSLGIISCSIQLGHLRQLKPQSLRKCVQNGTTPKSIGLFSWRYNPLWLHFHSPVADFSLLVFEVS
jgi:hypothetical protein